MSSKLDFIDGVFVEAVAAFQFEGDLLTEAIKQFVNRYPQDYQTTLSPDELRTMLAERIIEIGQFLKEPKSDIARLETWQISQERRSFTSSEAIQALINVSSHLVAWNVAKSIDVGPSKGKHYELAEAVEITATHFLAKFGVLNLNSAKIAIYEEGAEEWVDCYPDSLFLDEEWRGFFQGGDK